MSDEEEVVKCKSSKKTYRFLKFRFWSARIPSVVQNENVGLWDFCRHFVEERFFLNDSKIRTVRIKIEILTAKVIVDSAFKTRTKTSAFKQWLSIQSSRFCDTSTPGESTNTTSSRSKLQRSLGQKMRTSELSQSFSWHNALANCFTD